MQANLNHFVHSYCTPSRVTRISPDLCTPLEPLLKQKWLRIGWPDFCTPTLVHSTRFSPKVSIVLICTHVSILWVLLAFTDNILWNHICLDYLKCSLFEKWLCLRRNNKKILVKIRVLCTGIGVQKPCTVSVPLF